MVLVGGSADNWTQVCLALLMLANTARCSVFDLALPVRAVNLSANSSSKYFSLNSSSEHFGLAPELSWSSFFHTVSALNNNTDHRIYRLLIVARHGEGIHNVAESKYGSTLWNSKWSRLNGDGELQWGPDANLSTKGVAQADLLFSKWAHEVHAAGLFWPTIKYASPLSRAILTAQQSFGISLNDSAALFVMENLRETIGAIHRPQYF